MTSHLLILGERDALAWVLRNERMAFASHRANDAAELMVGDILLLYTTRGCFHNPTRDRGRVVGTATVTSPVEPLADTVVVMGREFQFGCTFDLVSLAPRHEGVVLAELVPKLNVFPNERAWSARMRRPLLSLPASDARLIQAELDHLAREPQETLADYL